MCNRPKTGKIKDGVAEDAVVVVVMRGGLQRTNGKGEALQ